MQLIDKYERQSKKIHKLNQSINELLEVKLDRDELQDENTKLLEANKRYHEHTSELQEKLEKLIVSYCMLFLSVLSSLQAVHAS